MPKLRKSEAEKAAERREADLQFVGVTIKTACEISCGTVAAAAERMGRSKSYVYSIIKQPERMTVDDLFRLAPLIPERSKPLIMAAILP